MSEHDASRRPAADGRDPGRRAAYAEGGGGFDPFGADRFGGERPGGPRRRGRGGPFLGGGPFGGGRGRGRGPGRARRGDVRSALLALLAERPMHGYEMIQELGARTGGAWTPSPGSVYPTLTLLEEEGLVTAEEAEGKRRFTLSEAGNAAVTEREGPPPWEQVVAEAGPEVHDLRRSLTASMGAVQQLFRVGTPAQQARAVEILDETRRKLYEVLAAE